MYSIEIENLTKKFKEKTAVNNVSLKIKQGDLFALLGTNGAGKTTTIKMLSTLILPTSGNIKIKWIRYKQRQTKDKRNFKCITTRNCNCNELICKRKFGIYGRSISNKKFKRKN